MPELPEVENVVQALRKSVGGDVIRGVRVLRRRLIDPMSVARFRAGVRGRQIEDVRRRGKFILVELTGGRVLLVHLRMTGSFVYAPAASELPGTTRVIFQLQSGRVLGFADRRNLGVMKLVPAGELDHLRELQQLGLEPLQPDFTWEQFGQVLARSRRSIKEFLLDQTKVVGLGNIYAAEALHRAGISPRRPAATIARSRQRLRALHQSIIQTLREAIRTQRSGTPLHFEIIGDNGRGRHRQRADVVFRVYDREAEPCFTCGRPIRRIKQGERSTYYCPQCQK